MKRTRLIALAAGPVLAAGLVAVLVRPTPARAQEPKKDDAKPIRALFVAGGCCHDYAKQKDIITQGISARANVEWVIAYDPEKGTGHKNPVYENPEWYKGFDIVVHDECSDSIRDLDFIERVLKPHKEGLPGIVLHCAMHSYRTEGWNARPPAVTPWFAFTGLPSTGHGAQLPIALTVLEKDNPVTKSLTDWTTGNEELYNNAAGKVLDTATPLVKGKQTSRGRNGQENTTETVVVWTNVYNGKAKVFGTTLGHNNTTVSDPRYLDMLTRGMLWSLGKLDEKNLKTVEKAEADKPAEKAVAK